MFRTIRTLSSWLLSVLITLRNSSDMSSLFGSNNSRIRSHRLANQPQTCLKSYPRCIRCFSPDSTPGVSTNVISSRIRLSHSDP